MLKQYLCNYKKNYERDAEAERKSKARPNRQTIKHYKETLASSPPRLRADDNGKDEEIVVDSEDESDSGTESDE